jgi:hypothetical protein
MKTKRNGNGHRFQDPPELGIHNGLQGLVPVTSFCTSSETLGVNQDERRIGFEKAFCVH